MNRAWLVVLGMLLVLGSASLASAQPPPDTGDGTAAAETRPGASALAERHAIGNTLWVTGLSVLAPSYVLTGAVGTTLVMIANARSATIAESWIPIAGPWIMLADSRGFDSTQIALTVVAGTLQALGCAAFIAGLVLENEGPADAGTAHLWLAPSFTADLGGGLSLAGVF